jgi:DNA processing protein
MKCSKEKAVSAPPLFALQRLNEAQRAEFRAALALRHTRGLGPRSCRRLLERFGSALSAVQRIREWNAANVRADVSGRFAEDSRRENANKEWELARRLDAEILLWTDPRYPDLLRRLPDAPLLLYCRGDMRLLDAPRVAVVGSRRCSAEGLAAADMIASRLAACGITIVSGLALGIDGRAHLAALRHPAGTIAVLGTGIDVVYPRSNAGLFARITKEGLALSEFMPSSKAEARHFPVRNRLISGLSLGVLVVEAANGSGSLITARFALEQNREVYAVPGSLFTEFSGGCRNLIRQGARAVFSADDILLDLAPLLKTYGIRTDAAPSLPPETRSEGRNGEHAERAGSNPPRLLPRTREPAPKDAPSASLPLSGDRARILGVLREEGECHIDALARRLEFPASRLSGLLVSMEMESLVRRLPGMRCVPLEHPEIPFPDAADGIRPV